MSHHEVEVMGTIVTFDLFDERGFLSSALDVAYADAARDLKRSDEIFSTWNPDSVISRLRRGEVALAEVPEEVIEVLDLCRRASLMSAGWFDPWSAPSGVDPTGLVKGWAAQRALVLLERLGARGVIVNAAGDICVSGSPDGVSAFQVGIVNPFDTTNLACAVRVSGGIATSGDYERGEHLFNPFTGECTARGASATVSGPDLGIADALATALVVGGREMLAVIEGIDDYEALLIERDRSWALTAGFDLVSEVTL